MPGLKSYLKQRYTSSMNLASILHAVLRRHFSKHGGDASVEYSKMSMDIRENNSISDRSTAFYLRVLLQFGYETVIEIGTFTGERVLAVKQCLPQIAAFGLDIGPGFRSGFERQGVRFAEYKLDFFDRKFPRPLVVCNCTLNYFPPEALREFLAKLGREGFGIAFCEPVPHFAYEDTLRRSEIAYYHPYPRVLKECGFELLEPDPQSAVWHSFSTSIGEFTYMNYARPAAAPMQKE